MCLSGGHNQTESSTHDRDARLILMEPTLDLPLDTLSSEANPPPACMTPLRQGRSSIRSVWPGRLGLICLLYFAIPPRPALPGFPRTIRFCTTPINPSSVPHYLSAKPTWCCLCSTLASCGSSATAPYRHRLLVSSPSPTTSLNRRYGETHQEPSGASDHPHRRHLPDRGRHTWHLLAQDLLGHLDKVRNLVVCVRESGAQ